MLKRLSSTFLLVGTLALFGCMPEPPKLPNYDRNSKRTHDQSLVVVKLDNVDSLYLRREGDPNNREFRILRSNGFTMTNNYVNSIYTVEPGIYYISYIGIQTDTQAYSTIAPGVCNGEITYGAYDIKPGEVLYLGDIEVQWKTSVQVKKITMLDHLTNVKRDLASAGYSDLEHKIVSAKFYANGTKLSAIP